jgi:hypothetical protein
MADLPERLFRDDAGAAIERLHRLEEENRALRAELEHLRRSGPENVPGPYRVGTVALCIATIAVGATLAFSTGAVGYSAPPPPMPHIDYTVQAPPTTQMQMAPPPGCNPPYYYDRDHNRVFKKECL